MSDRSADDPTVRERRSEDKVARAVAPVTDRDAPATVPMDAAAVAKINEPRWEGETHARGALLGRYVVLSLLGAGGMGEVYTAYDPALDRRVALKVIKPYGDEGSQSSARGLLLAEAQALAKLSHPNVVAVYDVGTIDADVYMAMEHVEGITLNKWLREEHTWQEIIDIFVEAGRGLESAHAAGVVHRDFKPENVIIGKDGRVRVIDFGIALVRKTMARAEAEGLVGTPAYMAPEQFMGGEVGPAADQFSFAVALYWALWRQHAFPGDNDAALKFNVVDGNLTMPPVGGPVPTRVRDAVVRALSKDPAARHPSLTDLLAALKPPPRRSLLPFVVGGGVLLAAAATVVIVGLTRSSAAEPCTGFERELDSVWGPARKAAVQQRVTPDGWPAIERTFNAYASDWANNKRAACRATSVTREQTPAVMERRMTCLDTRRRELDAALAIVAAGGAPSAKAIEIGTGLRSPSSCANLATLAPLPTSAPAAAIQAIESGLAEARAQRLAGEYADARKVASQVLAETVNIRWAGATARALVERGLSEAADGDPKSARESLFEAIRHGDEAGDAASTAGAWIALVSVEASGLREPSEALRWAKHAEVALAKGGADQEQQGQLLHNIAAALRILDRNADALDHETRALALFEHAFGQRHVRVANQRASIATSLRTIGKLDDAAREAEAALKLLEDLVGPTHPYVASVLNSLGLIYDEQDQLDKARAALERAIAISERELGPSHARLANPLLNLTSLERRAGHFDKAAVLWQRAYEIRVASLGANHPDVTRALHGKLLDFMSRGLDTEARALVAEVVTRQGTRNDPVELASALSLRCELERREGKLDTAAKTCSDAIAALSKTTDPTRTLFVYAYAARVAAHRNRHDEAAKLLAHAQSALGNATRDSGVAKGYVGWAATHVALAAGRRDEAVATARAARAALLAHGQNFIYVVNDLERIQ